MECSSDCGCDPSICKNRDVQQKNRLFLEKDVKLTTAYGLDVYTCRNIINALPTNIDFYIAYDFIMNKL